MIDHRKLGRELELFASEPLIGAGLPLWLPDGAAARYAVESYVHELERRAGFRHVYSPNLAKPALYERSGHLPYYADDMFPVMAFTDDDRLILRPSLCPHHAMVYRARGRSYRELPLRIAEIGYQHRAERSGVLGGLSRVRQMALNDAHIFCREDQVAGEIVAVLDMVKRAHAAVGVVVSAFRLSLRGPGEKYVGDDDLWRRAEALLRDALGDSSYVDAPGEAAFYGPKIDMQIVDPAGRESTIATVQVDFHQPEQFDLSYRDADGVLKRPVMVHRSVVGSFERLFAHLIEVHAGAFPAWYAPVQVLVAPITDSEREAAERFADECLCAGLRAELLAEGQLSARVRAAAQRKVPFIAVIGRREAEAGEVSLRRRDGSEVAAQPLRGALAVLLAEAAPPL
jgi:threonyl-tRNA synthetase